MFNNEDEFVSFYNGLTSLEKIWYYKCGAFLVENNQIAGKISENNNWMESIAKSIKLFDFSKNFQSVPIVKNNVISDIINNKIISAPIKDYYRWVIGSSIQQLETYLTEECTKSSVIELLSSQLDGGIDDAENAWNDELITDDEDDPSDISCIHIGPNILEHQEVVNDAGAEVIENDLYYKNAVLLFINDELFIYNEEEDNWSEGSYYGGDVTISGTPEFIIFASQKDVVPGDFVIID